MENEDHGISQKNYALFCDFLKDSCGVDLKDNRAYLVSSRLSPLLRGYGCMNLNEFIEKVLFSNDSFLRKIVVEAMVTHETKWFRDGYPFEFLVDTMIPEIKDKSREVKIWSAGCSMGQEPYSIAMAILRNSCRLKGLPLNQVRIFATDLSMSALNFAREGVFCTTDLSRGLSKEYMDRFFSPVGASSSEYRICDDVKSMVCFRLHNLIKTGSRPFMGKCDAIYCRNVMIYFDQDTKLKVLNYLKSCLKTDGYLLLGSSEFVPKEISGMDMMRYSNGVVYKKLS